ncbi:hypothetical protein L7F22_002644 [Adiantum nelumboides]|nr:hypothetical protein [Adiantum nelumboides]
MHHPLFRPLVLLLCLALSCSFHGELSLAQDFNFASGKLTEDSLTSLKRAVVDSTGTLTLDASAGEAQAFYGSPVTLYDTISRSVHSFSTFFTFASNATNGNGTVAFVIVPDPTNITSIALARNTFTIEFDTSCATGMYNGSDWFDGRHAYPGSGGGRRGRGGRGRGFRGGLGGFQVVEYANNTQIARGAVGGYGPNWDGQPADGSYFCSQTPPNIDLTNPTFQYQVVVEYNASTDTVWVGSPSCGAAIARTTQFAAQDLSNIITTPVYVGFMVTGGGIFNLSQWNLTSNATTSSVSNLALSSTVDSTSTPTGVSDGGNDGGRHSGNKLGKGYVIAFSVLGAAIGIGAFAALCCLCAYRRRKRVTSARFVAKGVHSGTIPDSKVVFDAVKPAAPPAKIVLAERDTIPLNNRPDSAFHGSTGTASWLHPVAPR